MQIDERGAVFGRFLKRRKRRAPRRLPRRQLAPVDEIVEQGLLVDDVAVRMSVKNDIIMNALKRNVDYDAEQIAGMVRDALTMLADEHEQDAGHIHRMLGEIRDTGRSSWSDSEYRGDDNRTLRHRCEVYETIARALRERAADDGYIRETTRRASEAAWAEIGDSLKERATHPYYAGGASPEYQQAREGRIQQLIEKDLTELVHLKTAKPSRVRRLKERLSSDRGGDGNRGGDPGRSGDGEPDGADGAASD